MTLPRKCNKLDKRRGHKNEVESTNNGENEQN